MLEIRARDYFSLKYDAAAQNRISSISGKNYIRGKTEETKTIKVDEVTLTATKEKVTLPFKVLPVYATAIDEQAQEYHMLSRSEYEETYKPLTFGQGVPAVYSYQHLLFAQFEVIFRDLNLPEGVIPEVSLSYEAESLPFAYAANISDSVSRDAAYLKNLNLASHMRQGAYITFDWENMWIGAAIKETEDREIETSDGDGYNDLDYNKELRTTYCYNCPVLAGTTNQAYNPFPAGVGLLKSAISDNHLEYVLENADFELDDLEDIVRNDRMSTYPRGGYFRGGNYKGVSIETELLNRDTFRVLVTLPIVVDYESFDPMNSTWQGGANIYEWLKSINVQIAYPQMSWSGEDFNIQLEEEKDLYPYKFENTRMGSIEDKVLGHSWSDYYSKLLLEKYGKGRHYVELKMRAKFMLENAVGIDSTVQIYDLKNRPITRDGKVCSFKVKRIIKSFANNEFYYIINCLEE